MIYRGGYLYKECILRKLVGMLIIIKIRMFIFRRDLGKLSRKFMYKQVNYSGLESRYQIYVRELMGNRNEFNISNKFLIFRIVVIGRVIFYGI